MLKFHETTEIRMNSMVFLHELTKKASQEHYSQLAFCF